MRGYGAYKNTQVATAVQNGRDLEYRLLAQVTGGLMKARDGKVTIQEKYNWILQNEKVWGVFLADVNDPANALPQQLKGGIASLALWVMKETKLVMSDDSAPLDDLIEINRQIMAGLKPEPQSMAG
ncbi:MULTISPECIES: flagellar biosynthesis regulator FlaF [Thalassobaculum]|uniref:Protein FlaF n=1 Tax=Thalassobaculum litoreum DSM 18839 TaxID=1123362 RepID=A0A8G2BKQ1_9PROT|nr:MULTISPECIES: flagellar biosynthesis regulator FlaF [Thalassobaculum]SDG27413.1 protein FlaF [Thalassobaculum litoreum DSM 18839]